MRISVVIPALNEAKCIERAVSSAWAAAVDEVVVVDGGSHDATVGLAESCGARVIRSERGRAKQQNLGAAESSGEVLLFLHADGWLSPGVGQQIRECLADGKGLGGALGQRIDAEGFLYRLLEHGNAARVRWRGMAYGDQAIFMRREVFQQLGGFPEVELMEDLLLMRAFRKKSRPKLLPGPVFVDPRRWQRRGVLRQTLCNWSLVCAHALGVTPDRLARFYPPHSEPKV